MVQTYITSVGESTTDICQWSLERLGFKPIVIKDTTSLWDKLNRIFKSAEEDILRIDADVIVNRNVINLTKQNELWWYQALTFDWHKQDITHGGIQFIRKECLPAIKKHINEAARLERPESYLSRLEEFHNPRVFGTYEVVCGLNGYKQDQADIDRVKNTKLRRGQSGYDWELAKEIEQL